MTAIIYPLTAAITTPGQLRDAFITQDYFEAVIGKHLGKRAIARHKQQVITLRVIYRRAHDVRRSGGAILGIIAQYDTDPAQWYACHSHGNFVRNTTHGGTWHGSKSKPIPALLLAAMQYKP